MPTCTNQSSLNETNINQSRMTEDSAPSSVDVKQERTSPHMIDTRQICSDNQVTRLQMN